MDDREQALYMKCRICGFLYKPLIAPLHPTAYVCKACEERNSPIKAKRVTLVVPAADKKDIIPPEDFIIGRSSRERYIINRWHAKKPPYVYRPCGDCGSNVFLARSKANREVVHGYACRKFLHLCIPCKTKRRDFYLNAIGIKRPVGYVDTLAFREIHRLPKKDFLPHLDLIAKKTRSAKKSDRNFVDFDGIVSQIRETAKKITTTARRGGIPTGKGWDHTTTCDLED